MAREFLKEDVDSGFAIVSVPDCTLLSTAQGGCGAQNGIWKGFLSHLNPSSIFLLYFIPVVPLSLSFFMSDVFFPWAILNHSEGKKGKSHHSVGGIDLT